CPLHGKRISFHCVAYLNDLALLTPPVASFGADRSRISLAQRQGFSSATRCSRVLRGHARCHRRGGAACRSRALSGRGRSLPGSDDPVTGGRCAAWCAGTLSVRRVWLPEDESGKPRAFGCRGRRAAFVQPAVAASEVSQPAP